VLTALLQLSAPQFKLFLDSIIWGFKHTMRNVAEIGEQQVLCRLLWYSMDSGLHILEDLLHNIDKDSVAQSFYQSYLLNLIEHMFSVITDSSHAGSMLMNKI